MDKVDLVMWTKNGGATLPAVLKRIAEAIPSGSVNKRVIADDWSTDNTREIAKSFGWTVVANEGKGISDNANTALKAVESEFFVSFEQDLLLARDWWLKVPRAMENPLVAVASGMRFSDKPRGVRRLQEYVAKKYRGEAQLESWLRGREMSAFTLGKTLDNTIYRTAVIRELGGYPKMPASSGVDTALAYMVSGRYLWFVDYSVQSDHLRQGLMQELNHQYWYANQLREMWRKIRSSTGAIPPPVTRKDVFFRFAMSPFTGLFMGYKTREPSIAYIHFLLRLYYLLGYLGSAGR